MASLKTHARVCVVTAIALTSLLLTLSGCDSFDGDDSRQVTNTNHTATEAFSFDVPVTTQTRIRIQVINGSIDIDGRTNATAVAITGEKRVGSDDRQDAVEHLDDLEVHVTERSSEVFVQTDQPDNPRGRNYQFEFTITVPESMDVEIVQINGPIGLYDLASNSRVELINGTIDAKLTVPDNGSVDFSVVNGNIDLSVPVSTSALVDCQIVNGDIRTSNLNMHSVNRSTRSVRGTLGDGNGSIVLATVNGVLTLRGF